MLNNYKEKIRRINCLSNDLNLLYHQAALKLGVSDSALFVLYMIYDRGDNCLLYDICKEIGISKQTINSVIRKLEEDDILYLKQDRGRMKRVCLTEKGKSYVKRTGARLHLAECGAFSDWTENEIDTYIKLMEKYNITFGRQVEKLSEGDFN